VFDEVDSGVGGAVAEVIGAKLAAVAHDHQVLCITHLPQIAAHAAEHFSVSKRVSSGRTMSEVVRLGEEERVEELARMAAGSSVTKEARRHAKELLRFARGEKARL
jgi:DNA repair protein RecN (Recombination protein N)